MFFLCLFIVFESLFTGYGRGGFIESFLLFFGKRALFSRQRTYVLLDVGKRLDAFHKRPSRCFGFEFALGDYSDDFGKFRAYFSRPAVEFDVLAFKRICVILSFFRFFRKFDNMFFRRFRFGFKSFGFAFEIVDFFFVQIRRARLTFVFRALFDELFVYRFDVFVGLRDKQNMLVVVFYRPFEFGVSALDFGVDFGDFTRYAVFFFLRVFALIKEVVDFVEFELFAQSVVSSRFFRLFGKGFDLPFEFGGNIDYTADIVARSVEFTHGFEPFGFGLRDAYRFFENGAAVFGLRRQNFGNFALPDNRIPFFTYAAFVQRVYYVAQSCRRFVYIVFAFARTEKFTREYYFVDVVTLENTTGVVERQRNFAVRKRLSVLRAVEDNVLHARSAHGLGGHFAEHPPDGVRNVTLSATVRTDYTGNAVIESDFLFIGKGFETDQFNLFEIHLLLLVSSFFCGGFTAFCFGLAFRLIRFFGGFVFGGLFAFRRVRFLLRIQAFKPFFGANLFGFFFRIAFRFGNLFSVYRQRHDEGRIVIRSFSTFDDILYFAFFIFLNVFLQKIFRVFYGRSFFGFFRRFCGSGFRKQRRKFVENKLFSPFKPAVFVEIYPRHYGFEEIFTSRGVVFEIFPFALAVQNVLV